MVATVFTGSKRTQQTPTWGLSTLTHAAAVSVWRAQSSGLQLRAVCTVYPRGKCARLMPGLITVLWLHVDRFCLGRERDSMSKVGTTLKNKLRSLLLSFFLVLYVVFFTGENFDTFLSHPMVVALIVSVIFNIIFICVLCKMARRSYLQSRGTIVLWCVRKDVCL